MAGGALDFRAARSLGHGSAVQNIDHNFCLSTERRAVSAAARLYAPASGIALDLATTEPGLQVYTGAGLAAAAAGADGSEVSKGIEGAGLSARHHGKFAAVALEAQVWPDAPNHEGFPSAELLPGQEYRQVTRYQFSQLIQNS